MKYSDVQDGVSNSSGSSRSSRSSKRPQQRSHSQRRRHPWPNSNSKGFHCDSGHTDASCCLWRSWLMMLLIVGNFVYVSMEIMPVQTTPPETTTTTAATATVNATMTIKTRQLKAMTTTPTIPPTATAANIGYRQQKENAAATTTIIIITTTTITTAANASKNNQKQNIYNRNETNNNRSSIASNTFNMLHYGAFHTTPQLTAAAAAASVAATAATSASTSLTPASTTTTAGTPTTAATSALAATWRTENIIPAATIAARRYTRDADADEVDRCRLFNEGDPTKNEFYSPEYPNLYPKNINCTRVITAPKGQIIRLDFRNAFNIEAKEECKFDFLEIRDGQYGFSTLLGKYCGSDFPPEITSKERYLWLHFHSDETIEYTGFNAVYEFLDRSREAPSTDLNCTIEKAGYEGIINSTDVPSDIRTQVVNNKIPLDCIWRIQVQEKWKIQLKFLDFHLSRPNDCDANFLDIFPEQTVMPLRVKNFCGSAGESITADSNILHMRFFAEQIAINSTFAILYTAFRDRTSTGCTEEEYDCEDATCISSELKCNGMDNCKFRWDEEGCSTETTGQSEHVTIIIIVFGLILGGMVITFVVNCIRKIIRDQKIIREHIRESKESKLDEMGRHSKARSRENISRQKHSQTSLQILDDVSNRYYREAVPISTQSSKADFKEKEHSILRHHNDMTQTSLCSGSAIGIGIGVGAGDDDDSSTATHEQPLGTMSHLRSAGGSIASATVSVGVGPAVTMVNACDMGCQTRESLFANTGPSVATLMRQKSTSSSIGAGIPPPPPRFFSTFGYEQDHGMGMGGRNSATPPIPTPPTAMAVPTTLLGTLTRRSTSHTPQHESLEMEERHSGNSRPHHYGIIVASTATPAKPQQEICHHHHQHQQHHQQQQQQQQQHQHQQKYAAGGNVMPHHGQTTTAAAARMHHHEAQLQHHLPPMMRDEQQHQHQQRHPHAVRQQLPTPPPPMTLLKGNAGSGGGGGGSGGGGGGGGGGMQQTPSAGKPMKNEESKVFIDIRNSAPDVIIMTSH